MVTLPLPETGALYAIITVATKSAPTINASFLFSMIISPCYDVIDWAADRKIFFTRARPYKKNDQATIESKDSRLVRRYGFY